MKKFALIAALLAGPAFAHDYTVGDLTVLHPVAYPSPGMSGAGYMEIVNTGEEPDTLLSVSAGFPRVELHLSAMNADGVMTMTRQESGIVIAPGETVTLEPGGLHVMFMGVEGGFNLGQEIEAVLTFEKAGDVVVVFKVEERPAEGADHSGMDHGADQ